MEYKTRYGGQFSPRSGNVTMGRKPATQIKPNNPGNALVMGMRHGKGR